MLAITGTSGFVGRALLAEIQRRELAHTVLGRGAQPPEGTSIVIDVAGLAHQQADEADFFQANYHRPMTLFRAAKAVEVKRFIYVSSVAAEKADNSYGRSKRATEADLIRDKSPIEVAIVRPPLIYGPGARGNFRLLTKLALTGLPLPLSSVDNHRSLVGRSNLIDALLFLAKPSPPVKDIYTVTDGQSVSLTEILEAIRAANGIGRRLFPADKELLASALSLFGLKSMASQLFGDLEFDDSRIRSLGWNAPIRPLAAPELVRP